MLIPQKNDHVEMEYVEKTSFFLVFQSTWVVEASYLEDQPSLYSRLRTELYQWEFQDPNIWNYCTIFLAIGTIGYGGMVQ